MNETPNKTTGCQFCGAFHGLKCPAVKALEYHPNGSLKRVEFLAPNDYPPITAQSLFGYDIKNIGGLPNV